MEHLLAAEARPKGKIVFTAKEKRTAYEVKQKTVKQAGSVK